MFRRTLEYHAKRFHEKQTQAWLAYKAGLDLHLPWGRRAGKSDLIAEIFIEDIENHGRDCLYIALTQAQAFDIFWPKLEERLRGNKLWRPNYNRHEWKHLPSNALISHKGADLGKHRLRGSAKKLVALDEYAFYRDPSIVKDVIVPMLADYNGQLLYSSSPNGENHFHELEKKAKSGKSRLFSIKATMFDNPFISSEGRDRLLEEYTGKDDPLYRQEVLGEYIVLEGMAFAIPQDSYIEDRWDHGDLENSYHWRGVDHGFNDPTACIWLAYNPRKGYFQIYSDYEENQKLIHEHATAMDAQEPFSFLSTYSDVDPQIIAEYQNIGFDMIAAHKHGKNARILRMLNMLKTGRLKISRNCTTLLSQMKTYVWDQDGNDHCVDGANYVVTNATVPEERPPEFTEDKRLAVKIPDDLGDSQDFGD